MSKIRLAIAGMGNCASSLVQGITYYADADPADRVPGLMHVDLGGYHVRDIELVAAFDVDAEKVGLDASKALLAEINNTIQFAEVPHLGVEVLRGPTLDGFGEFYRQVAEESPAAPVDVAQVLRDTKADVLVSYLPVGSEEAQCYYAQACLDAGVAFVNAIPVFIASNPEWAEKFRAAGVPIVGDDIKSQVGRHHRAPHPRPPVRGPRHHDRPHVPAELRREHGLHEHAGAQAPQVQEDLQDPVRHQPDRPGHLRPRRAHRPVRPRAVARGPQVGPHPARGPQLRRRAAHRRAQARGARLPELRRRDHRRRALRQDRPRPWPQRTARGPVGVLHEVARPSSTGTKRPTASSRPTRTATPT